MWDVLDCLSLGISMNSTQLLWRNGTTFHKPQSIISFTLCDRDALHYRMQMVLTHATESVTLNTDLLGLSLTVAGVLVDVC